MQAMRLYKGEAQGSAGTLRLEQAEGRAPAAGEIRVAIRALSLNFRDNLVVRGFFPAPDGLIPLSDAAGEVIAVGEGVTMFQPGDRVISVFHPAWQDGHIERTELAANPGGSVDGYACGEVTRPASHFTRAPANLSFLESAALPCAAVTAWRAVVTDGAVRPGQTVLIQGTGGVSLFALQFAKAAGATVIATSSSAEKLARLRALGADHVLNHAEDAEWGKAALELTGGLGVDHVIEVAGPNALVQSFVAARTGGHVALIGAAGGFQVDSMPFAVVQAKRLRLQGVTVGSRRDQVDMVRAIEANGIAPVIDRSFPLASLAEALGYLQSGNHFGKVCIEV